MNQHLAVQPNHRPAAIVLAVGTSALAVLATIVLVSEMRQPAYVMPLWVVLAAAVCVLLTMLGGAVASLSGRVTPWLAPAVTCFVLLVGLELFILAVPFALVLLALLVVRAVRRFQDRPAGDPRVGSAALLLTVGLVPLFVLIFLGRPVVACTPGGASSGLPVWAWLGAGGTGGGSFVSGSGSSDLSVSSGTETAGGTTYSWVCRGSTVVDFTAHR